MIIQNLNIENIQLKTYFTLILKVDFKIEPANR